MSDDEGDYEDEIFEDGDLEDADEAEAADGEDEAGVEPEGDAYGSGDELADDEPTDDGDADDDASVGADDAQDADLQDAGPEPAFKASPDKANGYCNPLIQMSNQPRIIYVVADEDRVTSDSLQMEELASVLAFRSAQIDRTGAHYCIEGTLPVLSDPVALAMREILQRRCPVIVRRPLGYYGGQFYVEQWPVNSLIIPPMPEYEQPSC